jgi:hypothetical protein
VRGDEKQKEKKEKRNAHHCLTRLGQRERGGIPFAERSTQVIYHREALYNQWQTAYTTKGKQ